MNERPKFNEKGFKRGTAGKEGAFPAVIVCYYKEG